MDEAEFLRLKRQQESPFAALYEAARQRDADFAAEGRRPVLGGLLSKEPVAGTDTIEYEGIKSMLLGLLSPAASALDAPMAAYQGNIPMEDMTAEALGTAGLAMTSGGAVSRPSGSVGMGGRVDAERPAQRVARLLREGRADEVTDDVLANLSASDTNELFRLYDEGATGMDLPMDEASRMARSEGFNPDYFHGSNADITGFDRSSRGTFLSSSPDVADSYVSRDGGQIYPVSVRGGSDFPRVEGGGSNFNRIPESGLPDEFEYMKYDNNGRPFNTDFIAGQSSQEGSPGVMFADIVDRGPNVKTYLGETLDEAKARAARASMPSDVTNVRQPQKIRSRFARFDPRLSRNADLLAANASKSGGLLGAGLGEAQRQARGILDVRDPANQDIPRQLPENNVLSPVDSLTQADLDAATPFARASGFDAPRAGGGRAKDPALFNRYSKKKQTGVPPSDWSVSGRRMESKVDTPREVSSEDLQKLGYTDLFGFVADGTMANTVVDQINGVNLPRPVMQQGGHEFGDNKNALAFMSDGGAMSTKANVWDKLVDAGGRPAVTPMTMGPAGGDFSMHQTMNLVQMIQGMLGDIDPDFVPLAGAAKNNKRLLPEGMGLLSPELTEYVAGLNGGQRATLMKSLDTSPALQAGVPSVGAVRWASTDPNLLDVPSLSSGYRVFEPKTKDFFTLPGNHASYDTAVDRVGDNMTMGNDLRPWYLQFPDEAYPKILSSTPKGANMLNVDAMPKDIRGFQMNPKMVQSIDDQYVEANMNYDEILKTKGKEQADLYAIDALVNRAMMSGKY